MKRISLVALLSSLALPAFAQDTEADLLTDREPRGIGVGVMVGEPTGLTVAWRPNDQRAVQGHLSWSLADDRVRVSGDYLNTVAMIDPEDAAMSFPIYVGLGLTGSVEDEDFVLGGRVPVGITLLPDETPIDVFAEVAPTVYIVPETELAVEGAIGARLYF